MVLLTAIRKPALPVALGAALAATACGGDTAGPKGRTYPLHTDIVATTFWVGEVLDPNSPDGSQRLSAYDSDWLANYGGCDGVVRDGRCDTERRTAANDYFPTQLTPRQNPFYLDLPFDDLNDEAAFAQRAEVVPWAGDPGYADRATDRSVSFMKNRWVRIQNGAAVCFGQVEDAGPGEYDDAAYVFGTDDARPANTRYNEAGMDVSPALNGCLGFRELNGQRDVIDWQFVDDVDVPPGPWTRIITTNPPSPR
jgi:hypothetical protein